MKIIIRIENIENRKIVLDIMIKIIEKTIWNRMVNEMIS